jgi:pimeloyl-ACP methyl ester carboxylesterase
MTAPNLLRNSAIYSERRVPREKHQIYARDYAGADPAFVLMHGFPDNLGIYDRLAPILAAAGQRVVVFDFLGYGGSDKPADYPYTAKNLEGDLKAVADALQLEKVIPVAHDASGPTAIDWSLEHQDRVAAVALLNTYYDAAPTLRFPEFIDLFSDPGYRSLATALISDPAQFGWLLTFQGRQFLRDAPLAIQELTQKMLVTVVRGQFGATPSSAPAFLSLTRELREKLQANTRRVPDIFGLDRPVSLIWGAGDPYLNTGVAEHLKGLFPDADLTVLQAGHWPQIDRPNDVAEALLSLRDRAAQRTDEMKPEAAVVSRKQPRTTAVSYKAVRIEVEVPQPFAEFSERFEHAVPTLNRQRVVQLIERGAPWSEVVDDAAASAPHDFQLYWKMDLTPVMSLAGHTRRATEYLLGNHAIAEMMYRHDPAVAQYVPLRCAIYEIEGATRFVIEQPSNALASLGRHEISEVGVELDRKLANLFAVLGIQVATALSVARRAA